MTPLTTRLVTFAHNHLYLLAHLYDPILDHEPGSDVLRECSRKFVLGKLPNIRRHYFLPAVWIIFAFIYGTVGLELDARGCAALQGFTTTAHALFDSPYIFGHQFFPREAWPSTDLVIIVGSAGEVILYLFMSQNPMLGDRYRMMFHDDASGLNVWSASQSE